MSEKILCEECKKELAEEKYLKIDGNPNAIVHGGELDKRGVRQGLIFEALNVLQKDPNRFLTHYFGVKNYDRFGDQSEGCIQIGFGPKHGSIVFKIGLKEKFRSPEAWTPDRQRIAADYLASIFANNVSEHGLQINLLDYL